MTKEDELKAIMRAAGTFITLNVPANCACGKPNILREKLLETMKKVCNPDK